MFSAKLYLLLLKSNTLPTRITPKSSFDFKTFEPSLDFVNSK